MQIIVNDGYVTGYAVVGSVEDSIEIDETALPDNFFSDFAENKFLYVDGRVTENPDWHEPLEPIIESKVNELSNTCTQVIYNGIDIRLSTGEVQHFTLDEQDQANLSGIGLELAAGAEFITWHEDDKTKPCQFYSAEDATTIIQSLTVWKSYHITYFRDLRIFINSLENVDRIKAIQYGYELPDSWKSDVLKYYESIIKGTK